MKKDIKRLRKKADRLWYEYCKTRDNGRCQIGIFFPSFCFNDPVVQVHHIFSDSKHHNLSFDVENGITLCRGCHTALSFGNDSYKDMVRRIKDKDIYERLFEQSCVPGPHLCWKSISWVEDQIKILEELNKEIRSLND